MYVIDELARIGMAIIVACLIASIVAAIGFVWHVMDCRNRPRT